MSRPMWLVKLIKKNFKNRFIISRWTKSSTVMRRFVDFMLFEGDEIYYLPKDKVMINQAIEQRRDVVLPSDVIRHFIAESSHRVIMNRCICRESEQCKDFPVDLGCIFMGEATQKIHPDLGRQVSREEAFDHLQRATELGLVQMVGKNKIDTQWLGATPGNKLLTVCNCCPCCCLYKVLPDLDRSISSKITRMPGVTVRVSDRCKGCGKCSRGTCFVNAISMLDNKAVINETCVGCGRCVDICPHKAIDLTIGSSQFMETTIHRITDKVDVRSELSQTQTGLQYETKFQSTRTS